MYVKQLLSYLIIATFFGCHSNQKKVENSTPNQHSFILSSNNSVDKNFNSFIEQFSIDPAFQIKRTKYPLQMKQYDIDKDKDTIIYLPSSEFEMMDFRQTKSNTQYDQWKQEIVLDENHNKATIEIRGIDNGIMVDYLFEKSKGKWMLVGIDDSST